MEAQKQKIQKFEDLFVWQQARDLTKSVYAATNSWKDYGLKDQIQRAAVSVMSNIAEGFERGTKDEFLYFLYIARGSCGEVRAQLYVAVDQKYIDKAQFERIFDQADHTSRLLAKFIEAYKKKSYGGQRLGDSSIGKEKEFDEYLRTIINHNKVTR